jgi:membrane protein YqaA with SNARE-associated domain
MWLIEKWSAFPKDYNSMTTLTSLFIGAFLAATILPFSSEVMLVAALQNGEISRWILVFVATSGNVLGALMNWGIGGFFIHWVGHRWFPFRQNQIDKASERFNRYGIWSLLLAWVPIIGDPLTFIAGVLSVRLLPFLVLVSIGKAARYAFIGWAM